MKVSIRQFHNLINRATNAVPANVFYTSIFYAYWLTSMLPNLQRAVTASSNRAFLSGATSSLIFAVSCRMLWTLLPNSVPSSWGQRSNPRPKAAHKAFEIVYASLSRVPISVLPVSVVASALENVTEPTSGKSHNGRDNQLRGWCHVVWLCLSGWLGWMSLRSV